MNSLIETALNVQSPTQPLSTESCFGVRVLASYNARFVNEERDFDAAGVDCVINNKCIACVNHARLESNNLSNLKAGERILERRTLSRNGHCNRRER